jgi:hypothetical protein
MYQTKKLVQGIKLCGLWQNFFKVNAIILLKSYNLKY